MGSIYKALHRAGYLRPVVDSLNELIQRRRYEQGLQQLAEMLSGSENRIEDIYTGTKKVLGDANFQETPVDKYGSAPVPDNTPLRELTTGIDTKNRGSALQQLGTDPTSFRSDIPKDARVYWGGQNILQRIIPGVNEPEGFRPELETSTTKDIRSGPALYKQVEEGSQQETLKPYQEKTVPKYTPQEQNRLAGQEINSFLRRLITSQNIPPEKIQLAGSLLQQSANTYKSAPIESKIIPKGADLGHFDPTTNKWVTDYSNLDEGKGRDISGYELDDKGKPKVYTLDNGQKAFRKITKDANGNIINENYEEQSFAPKGNVTNVYIPGETGLTPETSKLIADIKNFDPYQKNKEGKYLKAGGGLATKDSEKIRMSPEDIKYAKDNVFENIKLQIFKKSPRAYQWVNNINKLWKDKGGSEYISPEDLNDEAIKHAKDGNLSDSDAAEIASFIKYYEQIYDGLTK